MAGVSSVTSRPSHLIGQIFVFTSHAEYGCYSHADTWSTMHTDCKLPLGSKPAEQHLDLSAASGRGFEGARFTNADSAHF